MHVTIININFTVQEIGGTIAVMMYYQDIVIYIYIHTQSKPPLIYNYTYSTLGKSRQQQRRLTNINILTTKCIME